MILYLIVLGIVITYYYCIRTFSYWKNKNVKGPKPIPFFGNYKDVALRRKHVGMLYGDLYKQYPEEKVIGLYRMTAPTLLIRDLDIVKQVMIKDFPCFPDRGIYYSKEGLSENLFHSDSETWQHLRNKFSPLFTTSKIKNLFHIYVNYGEKFAKYMEDITVKEPEQDVYRKVQKYAIGTTMAVSFGIKIDTFNEENEVFDIIDDKLIPKPLDELDMLIPGCLTKLNLSILHENIVKFGYEVLKTASTHPPAPKQSPSNVIDVIMNLKFKKQLDSTKKHSLLDVTEALLAAQAWVFYAAGYANNTLSLSYAMYHLAHNPDIQNKLIDEIDGIMEKYQHKLTYEAFKEMKYVSMIFEETLRMHSLTNGLVRCVAQSVKLEGLDLVLDAGTVVVVSPHAIHHDEKYYPEPEKFNPERFSPENIQDRHPCSFLTFGIGQRSCLGSQIGRVQFAIGLAYIFSKFRVETTENTINEIKYDPCRLLLTPQERIRLKFVRR